MPELAERRLDALDARDSRGLATYVLELAIVGVAYLVLATVGAIIPALHVDALPISLPIGVALAAVLLRGVRVWPAILAAALLAGLPTDTTNASLALSIAVAVGVALGHTLSPVLGGYLVHRWTGGCRTFETPSGVA